MRVALIHSFYSSGQPSGENRVVDDQAVALQQAGHEVRVIARNTDDLNGSPFYTAKSAIAVSTGFGPSPIQELHDFEPDVVHVHNLFPNFGTRWIGKWPGAVVATLHNYRSVCANGILYRGGHQCNECPQTSSLQAIRHRCYRDSLAATIPVSLGLSRRGPSFLKDVDRVVVTSSGSARILEAYLPGIQPIDLVPNFGSGESQQPLSADERSAWLAMGRFSPEKGFLELIDAWPSSSPLTLIGDGPQREAILAAARNKPINILPSMPIEQLRQALPGMIGLVFPSRWPEVAPQVVVEAMRVGLPVIAFRANVVSDLVSSTGAGAVYDDAASLASALDEVLNALPYMSEKAVRTFDRDWSEKSWLANIETVYSAAISIRRNRQ